MFIVHTAFFRLCTTLLFLAVLVQSYPPASCIASSENDTDAPQPVVVKRISISGNKVITRDEILDIISTSKKEPFIGELFSRDLALIRKLYTFKGYFLATVDADISEPDRKNRISLSISITENTPARIDSISHTGLEALPSELKKRYLDDTLLKKDSIFTVDHLIDERNRTVNFFREYGYSFMHEDSIRIQIDTTASLAGMQLHTFLPQKLSYGPVAVFVHDRDKSLPVRETFQEDSLSITFQGRPKLSRKLIRNYTAVRSGNITQQSKERKTLQNFGSTNVFSSVFIRKDSVRAGKLYTSLHLEPKPRYLVEPRLFFDNRYGSLFLGGAVSFENSNLFGGGENLIFKTDFGTQLSSSNDLLKNIDESLYKKYRPYELGISANISKPAPKHPGNYYTGTLEYSRSRLPILLDNQKGLLRLSYNAQLSPSSRLNFDFFEIEMVKKDSLDGFRELFITDLAENIGVDPSNPSDVAGSLDSLLQTNLNQGFRLQYYDSNQDDPGRKTTYTWNISLEEVGGLVYLIDKYLDTKSYNGFTDEDPQILGTPYSQFVKASGQFTFNRDITETQQIAGRIFLGAMTPYGKANATPDDRRFYAGGPNSMRGWLFNTLGPADNPSSASATLGADIKVEANLEYRVKFFKLFGQPSGIALFTDIGNIWDRSGPYAMTFKSLYTDFAWDAGVGLRLGSPIGPFRFDFGYKLYDPTMSNKWQAGNLDIEDFTFNFGIGEAF